MRAKSNKFKKITVDEKPKKDITSGFHQLCWSCQRVLDCSCSWSKCLQPVTGWNAVLVTNEGESKSSYAIFECPEFIPTDKALKRKSIKQCECCGRSFLSYGNLLCSYDCFANYHPVPKKRNTSDPDEKETENQIDEVNYTAKETAQEAVDEAVTI